MRQLQVLLLFYRKIVIPPFWIGLLPLLGAYKYEQEIIPEILGISLLLFIPAFHFMHYEVRKPDTYYFYYNMGWSKLHLWIGTFCLSFLFAFISILL